MKVHKYNSYEEYKAIQTAGNIKKIKKVFWYDTDLNHIVDYIEDKEIEIDKGICHGVRNGKEVEFFRQDAGWDVFGTEISHTANQFDNVIEWDFHETKPEWKSAFDFIYSNSFDHSYKPEECLDTWMDTLSENGRLFLHWTKFSKEGCTSQLDPFGATKEEYKEMIEKKHVLEDIITFKSSRNTHIFVVKKK